VGKEKKSVQKEKKRAADAKERNARRMCAKGQQEPGKNRRTSKGDAVSSPKTLQKGLLLTRISCRQEREVLEEREEKGGRENVVLPNGGPALKKKRPTFKKRGRRCEIRTKEGTKATNTRRGFRWWTPKKKHEKKHLLRALIKEEIRKMGRRSSLEGRRVPLLEVNSKDPKGGITGGGLKMVRSYTYSETPLLKRKKGRGNEQKTLAEQPKKT